MLFEFSRFDGVTVDDVCLITDIRFHDCILEATLVATKKDRCFGNQYYIKDKETRKFYASVSYKLIEYTGEIKDKFLCYQQFLLLIIQKKNKYA